MGDKMTSTAKASQQRKCVCCNAELVDAAISIEHILPQALGGKLKSDRVFCGSCNNRLGNEVDVHFVQQFAFFSTTLDIKRERSKGHAKVVAKHEPSGEEVHIGPDLRIKTTKVTVETKEVDGHEQVRIVAPSLEVASKIVKDYESYAAKTGGKVQIESKEVKKIEPKGPIQVELGFGGPDGFRGAAKIVLGLYIHKDGARGDVAELAEYVCSGKEKHLVWMHYIPRLDPTTHLTHDIIIATDTQKRLWGVVSIYGAASYIVKMGRVSDAPISLHYRHNVSEAKGEYLKPDWTPDGNDLELAFQKKEMPMAKMQDNVSAVMHVVHGKSTSSFVLGGLKEEWDRCVTEGKKTVDEEMIQRLSTVAAERIGEAMGLTPKEIEEVLRLLSTEDQDPAD